LVKDNFNWGDFQEEGLYCVMLGWLQENIKSPFRKLKLLTTAFPINMYLKRTDYYYPFLRIVAAGAAYFSLIPFAHG
jgi:hypothetical protein